MSLKVNLRPNRLTAITIEQNPAFRQGPQKGDKTYWRPRVFRPVVKGTEVWSYAVRLSHQHHQVSLSLFTPNREEAATRARD